LILTRKQELLRIFGPSRCFPAGRFSVDEGGNCLSGGSASHLMFKQMEFIHKAWSANHKASFSPATDKPSGREISGAGLGSFATFLAHQEK
jgi:hypothetical protein